MGRVKEVVRKGLWRVGHNYRKSLKGFKPYIMRKEVEGVKFPFLIGNVDGMEWYDLNATDPTWIEMRFLRDHMLAPGDIVAECGGHHGCSAVLMANWVGPRGKVITFEPHPGNFEILKRNVQINNLDNVEVVNKAVGSAKKLVKMSGKSNSRVVNSREEGKGFEVEAIRLDDFFENQERPELIKIDVEGFESEVLKGASRLLGGRPKLAIEIHVKQLQEYGSAVEDILGEIGIEKYDTWVQLRDDREPVRYDRDIELAQSKRFHLFCSGAQKYPFR